jgi:hypothetical protein
MNIFHNLSINNVIEDIMYILSTKKVIFEILNELYREDIIQKTIYQHSPSIIFNSKYSILEIKDEKYLNPQHEKIIKEYIINKNDNNLIDNQLRRTLKKNVDNVYNYIPIMCEKELKSHIDKDIICYYSHNLNELNYHSLYYKTIICRKSNCDSISCYKSHDLLTDFRLIYDYKNKEIINLAVKIQESKLFVNCLEHYTIYIKAPLFFSLETYKVIPCRLMGYCTQDPHDCFYYHNAEERRRPPQLFRYSNENCKKATLGDKNNFYAQLCNSVKFL